MKNNKITRADILLIAGVIVLALFLAALNFVPKKSGGQVEIILGGQVYKVLPLDTDSETDVEGLLTVVVENGGARVRDSVCKNRFCESHRPINSPGESIICAPNRIVIRISGSVENAPDFIV